MDKQSRTMSQDFYNVSILPYAGIILKICRAYTDNSEDLEDAYQEICLQVWKSRLNFKEQSAWSTWVYRISLNVCLTLLKKNKKGVFYKATNQLPDEVIADNYVVENDDLNKLYSAIRLLSDVDRAVILLYLEEKQYQEIAEIMGTNANNIGVRIKRIKKRLKKILDGKIN